MNKEIKKSFEEELLEQLQKSEAEELFYAKITKDGLEFISEEDVNGTKEKIVCFVKDKENDINVVIIANGYIESKGRFRSNNDGTFKGSIFVEDEITCLLRGEKLSLNEICNSIQSDFKNIQVKLTDYEKEAFRQAKELYQTLETTYGDNCIKGFPIDYIKGFAKYSFSYVDKNNVKQDIVISPETIELETEKIIPKWQKFVESNYLSKKSNVFILTGNIEDYVIKKELKYYTSKEIALLKDYIIEWAKTKMNFREVLYFDVDSQNKINSFFDTRDVKNKLDMMTYKEGNRTFIFYFPEQFILGKGEYDSELKDYLYKNINSSEFKCSNNIVIFITRKIANLEPRFYDNKSGMCGYNIGVPDKKMKKLFCENMYSVYIDNRWLINCGINYNLKLETFVQFFRAANRGYRLDAYRMSNMAFEEERKIRELGIDREDKEHDRSSTLTIAKVEHDRREDEKYNFKIQDSVRLSRSSINRKRPT